MIDFANGSVFKLNQVDPRSVGDEVVPLLIPEETILSAFKGIRDFVVFTNKRVIAVGVQGMTGKKKDYTSLPLFEGSVVLSGDRWKLRPRCGAGSMVQRTRRCAIRVQGPGGRAPAVPDDRYPRPVS